MKKMSWVLVAAVLAATGSTARGNDFEVAGIGGSWQPASGENRSVQMVSERVRIDIFQGKDAYRYYDTTVDFQFHNRGPATTVKMAFPESSNAEPGAKPSTSGFRTFRTSVDGKSVPVERVISQRKLSSGVEYQALWLKSVAFKAGERKAIQVKYRSLPGALAGVGWFAAYDFTGGNWFGKVEESVLTVALHTLVNQPVRAFFDQKPLASQRNKYMFTYKWTNWQADGQFRFWYGIAPSQQNADSQLFTYAMTQPVAVARQPLAPDQLVKNLYAAQKAGRSPFFQTKNRALLDTYFSKGLADLIWNDAKRAGGQVGELDFDPLYGSQDPQISNFLIMDTGWGGDKKFGPADEAVVQTTFKDSGQERMISYQFHQGKDKNWKIYDVHYRNSGEQTTLLEVLGK